MIPYHHKLKSRAQALRKNMTPAERRLWYDFLRNHPLQFRRQLVIHPYIADFYCHPAKLVIEVDGPIHQTSDHQEYDHIRNETFQSMGLRILRFSNDDVLHRFDDVCQQIDDLIEWVFSDMD